MAPLTAARNTRRQGDAPVINTVPLDVDEDTVIFAGSMVQESAGVAMPAGAQLGARTWGRAKATVDNTDGDAGAKKVEVERGTFKWDNSADSEEVTSAQIGTYCYAVDDHTVGKTDASGTLSPAGIVIGVEDDGVWVESMGAGAATGGELVDAQQANVPALTGTLTGTVNGAMVDVAATAAATAGGSTPTAAEVDAGIATAVASIVTGVNEQNKEMLTKINAILATLVAAGIMAAP